MKASYLYFMAGLSLAGLGWWIFWPEKEGSDRTQTIATALRPQTDVDHILKQARESGGRSPQSYRDLEQLSVSQLKEELKQIHESGGLEPPDEFAEGLLLALARKDYREAFLWTGGLFEDFWKWHRCLEIMGPEWGANDPEGLVLFLNDIASKKISRPGFDLSPILDPGNMETLRLLPMWIVDHNPRQAFQLAHLTNSRFGNDQIDLIERLQGPSDFAAALSAWQEPDPSFSDELRQKIIAGTTAFPAKQYFYVRGVIGKWKQVDPDSFKKSEFASWDLSQSE